MRRNWLIMAVFVAAVLGLGALSPSAAATPSITANTCDSITEFWTDTLQQRVPSHGWQTHDFACGLGPGDTGLGVFWLQQSLVHCYQQPVERNGTFDPATSSALRNVQARHGLPVDGIYGPQLAATMTWPWLDRDAQFSGWCTKRGVLPF